MELRVEDVLRLSNFDQILPEIIGLVEKSSVRSKDEEFRLFVDTCAALEGETRCVHTTATEIPLRSYFVQLPDRPYSRGYRPTR